MAAADPQLLKRTPFNLEDASSSLGKGEAAEKIPLPQINPSYLEEDQDDDISSLHVRAAEQAEHLFRRVMEEAEQAEQLVRKICTDAWNGCHFSSLPQWLQDNDYIHRGYRPPLPSVRACFKSIFRIHTETANIWTHLLGSIAFLSLLVYLVFHYPQWQERILLGVFLLSATLCMVTSSLFHTLQCHSERIGKLFSKLDYCGIALLIMGSFVPWLYYGFYCEFGKKVVYLSLVGIFGVASIVVSLWDKFGEPRYRWLRAGLFMAFGLVGVIPAIHYLVEYGFFQAFSQASLGWLFLMGVLYIAGALLYAARIPERFFPGKFDIWFHSHQLFHVFVVAAACVHFKGISSMAIYRAAMDTCVAEAPSS